MKIIIFGANEIGLLIATTLSDEHDIVVIDSQEKSNDFSKLDILYIAGNGINIKALEQAQIKTCDILIACSDNDEANIVACITAKNISNVQTICFIRKYDNLESINLLKNIECYNDLLIDKVIWPQGLLTQAIFRTITIPQALHIENFAHGKAKLIEYRIREDSNILNKKLKDCHLREETLAVGITRNDELFIPNGDTVFKLNDKVIFMGSSKSLDLLIAQFSNDTKNKVRNVSIIGGGTVGKTLAEYLEQIELKTKIIEKDYDRCEYLSEQLKSTLILNGDGSDLEFLKLEEIDKSDIVISVTNNDEKNLLCSLLVKQLGIKKVITRVSQPHNIDLFEKVGIDIALCARQASMIEIKNSVINKEAGILSTVEKGKGAILEVNIKHNFTDTQIMHLNLPKKTIIGIIQRKNRVIIPKGNTLIRANDSLIIFTTEENSDKIKEFFS